ncbi:MAG: hypothetical protein ABIJ21_05230 [Nanoarchaeota archaeon]
MGDKLSHTEHKVILIVVVLISTAIGFFLGKFISGHYENNDIMITLMFAMLITIAVLVIILLSIIVRLEEDFYWHVKKKL